jgi:nucleotide-binding universal stress UspA family protein
VFKKILVPTDGSSLATEAALRAVHLAKSSGASLMILYVQGPYPYTSVIEVVPLGLDDYMAAGRAEGLRAVDRIAAAAKEQGVAYEHLIVESGQVADAIVEAARSAGADLIAMGSHGRSGVARLMLGSVAAKVLALSSTPVLIFK